MVIVNNGNGYWMTIPDGDVQERLHEDTMTDNRKLALKRYEEKKYKDVLLWLAFALHHRGTYE